MQLSNLVFFDLLLIIFRFQLLFQFLKNLLKYF